MIDWMVPFARFNAGLEGTEEPFWIGLRHGSMRVELFAPLGKDTQQPHEQDELYIIHRGSGVFRKAGETVSFGRGDVIFVEAGTEHCFESFTEDFATWVIFWGPSGGERDS